jgi:hypothetical protein
MSLRTRTRFVELAVSLLLLDGRRLMRFWLDLQVFELGVVNDRTLFKSGGFAPAQSSSKPSEPSPFAGQVTCSIPFSA